MAGICLPIDAVSGAPSFPAAQHRVALGALAGAASGRPLGARSGIRLGAEPTVTVTATTYTVTPFSFVADPATGGAVGAYLGAFIANETGGVNAADASSTRIDRLDVQVPDDPAGASPLSARIIYTAGSAGSGVAPGAPVRSFPVGTITVPKAGSGSPSFTPTWPYVAGPAGVVPVRSQAERDALAVDGRLVVRLDTGEVEKRIGGSWSRVGGKRSAWVTASPIFNGSGIGTFPHGLNWTPSTAIIGQNGVSGSSGVHVLFISADAVNVTCKAVLVTTGAVFAGNAGVSAFLGE